MELENFWSDLTQKHSSQVWQYMVISIFLEAFRGFKNRRNIEGVEKITILVLFVILTTFSNVIFRTSGIFETLFFGCIYSIHLLNFRKILQYLFYITMTVIILDTEFSLLRNLYEFIHTRIFLNILLYILLLQISEEHIKYFFNMKSKWKLNSYTTSDNDISNQYVGIFERYNRELRTVITTIVGYIGLISDTPLQLQQEEYVKALKDSVDKVISLINNMAAFMRIENNAVLIDNHTLLDISNLMDNIIDRDDVLKNIDIIPYIDPEIPNTILGDNENIAQLLGYILDNAIKYTEQGHIYFNIELVEKKCRSCRISFTIKDTGIGLPEHQFQNIFIPLVNKQYEFGLKSGLGLPIAYRMAKLFKKGNLEIKSTLYKGTEVTFTADFPISKDKSINCPKYYNRMLLLTSEASFKGINSILLRKGYLRCDHVNDFESAISTLKKGLIQNDPFEIFIIDTMAHSYKETMNILIINSIRNEFTSLKLALVTSKQFITMNPTELFDGYIFKPIISKQLCNTLRFLLDNKEITNDKVIKSISSELLDGPILNVLIAEDNFFNLVVLKNLIIKKGHNCISTRDGLECLNVFKENTGKIDLIFMDYQMPILNGLEAAKKIREFEKKNNLDETPLIIFSADDGLKSQVFEANMNDFLIKPIESEKIQKILNEYSYKKKTKPKEKTLIEVNNINISRGCILIVEDNPFVAKITTQLLLRNSWDVDLAIDGGEAVQRVISDHSKYKCILMDMYLPNMDGLTATQLIREYEKTNNKTPKPIIMLTAEDTLEFRSKCIEYGCTSYLQKPLNYQALIKKLQQY